MYIEWMYLITIVKEDDIAELVFFFEKYLLQLQYWYRVVCPEPVVQRDRKGL